MCIQPARCDVLQVFASSLIMHGMCLSGYSLAGLSIHNDVFQCPVTKTQLCSEYEFFNYMFNKNSLNKKYIFYGVHETQSI